MKSSTKFIAQISTLKTEGFFSLGFIYIFVLYIASHSFLFFIFEFGSIREDVCAPEIIDYIFF